MTIRTGHWSCITRLGEFVMPKLARGELSSDLSVRGKLVIEG